MPCCDTIHDLGCFDYCQPIETGLTTDQTGSHRIIATSATGGRSKVVSLNSGDEVVFEMELNERMTCTLQVVKPDGTMLEAHGSECFSFTTQILHNEQ